MKKISYNLFIIILFLLSLLVISIDAIYNYKSKIFSAILNISYSNIAAIIFYFIQVYVPQKNKEKKAILINKEKIKKLCAEIDQLYKISKKIIEYDGDKVKINFIDENYIFFYKHNHSVRTYIDIKNYYYSFEKNIKLIINNMRSNIYFSFMPEKIIYLINEIEEYNKSMIRALGEYYPEIISFNKLNNNIEDLNKLSKKLQKVLKLNVINEIIPCNTEEIEDYKKSLNEKLPVIRQSEQRIQKINKEHLFKNN